MKISYTWSIVSMDTKEVGGINNFVVTTHWICSGTDGTNNASLAGATGFAPKEGSSYSDYSSLNQSQVIEWIQKQMGEERVAEVEADIASQLANNTNRPSLPWSA